MIAYYLSMFLQVLCIDDLIKPKLEEERANQIDLAKHDVVEQAIQTVKNRIRDRYEEDTSKDDTGFISIFIEL